MKKKAATKEPFLPFFVGDFLGATAEWDGEERALYMLLLSFQWTLGSLPNDARKLRKLVDYQESTFERWWPTVSTKFEVRTGRLLNARLEVHRAKTKELSEKNSASGRKGAAARWEGTAENMASASNSNGERHGKGMATATNEGGDRHKSVIPKRHPDTYGATDGNPSDPIPSDPIPDISSLDLSSAARTDRCAAGGNVVDGCSSGGLAPHLRDVDSDFEPGPDATPHGRMAVALRKLGVDVTSMHPTLDAWIREGITTDRLLAAVEIARQPTRKGPSALIAANYLDTIVRNPPRSVRQRQQDTNVDASREWLREQQEQRDREAKDATG